MGIERTKDKITPIVVPTDIQRKIDLYMDYFKNQTDKIFTYLEEYFRKQTALPPIVFKILVGDDVKQNVLTQKLLILEIASQMVPNKTIDEVMPLIEEREKKYYRLDTYMQNFRRRHEIFSKAQELIKKLYLFRINADGKNLSGVGETWFEILRSVHSKESGSAVIKEEIKIYEAIMDLIRENRSIVNVTGIVRTDVINAMFAMGNYVIESLFKSIDEVWPER